MADSKISALTQLTGANIATDDEMAIVDTSATTTKKTSMADLSARTETMTNKTLDTPVITGTGNADGELGRNSTNKMLSYYDNTFLGTIPRVIGYGRPMESKTNSVLTDQDYATIFTIPANYLTDGKMLRVTLFFYVSTGVSTVSVSHYLKLGSQKVYTTGNVNITNSFTRSASYTYLINGTAAPSAASTVDTAVMSLPIGINDNSANSYQPQNLATNGALAIIPGVLYSATGSTDTYVLRFYLVEELL